MLSFKNHNAHNKLYEKALTTLPELKTARNSTNPLFCLIIAQELFTFDKDLFEINTFIPPSIIDKRQSVFISSQDFDFDRNVASMNSVTVFNSYIEEVCTIRELVEKVINRYILKYSWTNNDSVQVSIGKLIQFLIV